MPCIKDLWPAGFYILNHVQHCSGHELIKGGGNYKGYGGEVRKGGDKAGPVVMDRSCGLEQSSLGDGV